MGALLILFAGGYDQSRKSGGDIHADGSYGNVNLSEDVLRWKSEVERVAREHDILDQVPILLAMMMVESGGRYPDLFQASESLGLPVNTLNERESIAQGVKYYAQALTLARDNEVDEWSAVQSYNFGLSYISFIATNSERHTTDLAERYSRDVVAPSLGNTTGVKNVYINAVSIADGRTYQYNNGGNFHYVGLVRQYIVVGTDPEGGTPSGAPTMKVPVEYEGKLTLPEYNGRNYNSSGSYPFGQCTWYAFNRMYQLGTPVDDFMGNGGDWGRTAQRLGYKTSNQPKVGWAMSIPGGVAGSSSMYGHVAIVEFVNSDGSVLVSECNVVSPGSGTVSWRVLSASVANQCVYLQP